MTVTDGASFFQQRRAGVLLHPTSLPATRTGARGEIGPAALRFLEFLAEAGCSVWQMLPTGPTHGDGSPYQSLSVHAGNPDLISIDWLVARGWLQSDEIERARNTIFQIAAQRFAKFGDAATREHYAQFCFDHSAWLDDYALFIAVREARGNSAWFDWPLPLRTRDASALQVERAAQQTRIDAVKFEQFVFFQQWQELRAAAQKFGIALFGDMPIFVAHDSADVWARQDLFLLDDDGQPLTVAGVPPDYFSATGQRWGNPHYRWAKMEADGFRWWLERLHSQLHYFDLIRIDHFRGFEAFWEIPAASPTAIEGRWVNAPGQALLQAMRAAFPQLPLVAENLGIITPEVEALRAEFQLPGMLILQFAFDGGPRNPYLPHNHAPLEVVYTGTHDNDTTLGWYDNLDADTRAVVDDYLGQPGEPMPWPLVRATLASVARLAIIPMQDLLALGSEHRMNIPGTVEGNWAWQFDAAMLPDDLAVRLRRLLHLYGRLP